MRFSDCSFRYCSISLNAISSAGLTRVGSPAVQVVQWWRKLARITLWTCRRSWLFRWIGRMRVDRSVADRSDACGRRVELVRSVGSNTRIPPTRWPLRCWPSCRLRWIGSRKVTGRWQSQSFRLITASTSSAPPISMEFMRIWIRSVIVGFTFSIWVVLKMIPCNYLADLGNVALGLGWSFSESRKVHQLEPEDNFRIYIKLENRAAIIRDDSNSVG